MKIRDDVLAVLSEVAIDDNARTVRIVAKLDRKLYVEVNKVLVAVGGAWSRKAQAHLFPTAPGPLLEGVMVSGEVTTHRDLGFFPTSAKLAAQLVEWARVEPGHRCLEPSAGEGSIVAALTAAGGLVTAIERDPVMRTKLVPLARVVAPYDDFLDAPVSQRFDRVVMNPPFLRVGAGDHLDHVRHAFSMLRPEGVLASVLPRSVEFRRDRRYREFREWFEGLDSDLKRLPDGSFKHAGTGVATNVLLISAPR